MRTRFLLLILSGGLSTALAADWQINWWTLDGGGGTSTNAGGLSLSGTVGQPDAGVMTGGTLRLVGGLWGFKQGATVTCPCIPTKTETEPNNVAANANDLGAVSFTTVVGTLPLGDVDYYHFTAPTNAKAWITVDTGGMQSRSATTRDSVVILLAGDGATVLESDDNDGTGNGGNSTIESGLASAIAGRTLPGGTVYVQVRGTNGVLAPYRLLLTVTTNLTAESEPNDAAATANPIVIPATPIGVRSGFLSTNDVDYYSVTVSGRSLLHISADSDPERDGASHNILVDLIGPSGSTVYLTANSSGGGQPDAAAEGFGFLVASSGRYYVRVREASGKTGTYHLMVAACAMSGTIGERPRLQVVSVTPSSFTFSLPAAEAYGFSVESSTDLSLNNWSDLPCEVTCANGLIEAYIPIGLTDVKRFIRIRGEWAPPPM